MTFTAPTRVGAFVFAFGPAIKKPPFVTAGRVNMNAT